MAKKDYLKEAREGFEKWIKLVCGIWVIWIFLDILPRLPTAIGDRLVEAIFRRLGI